jgi:hypothetical protein
VAEDDLSGSEATAKTAPLAEFLARIERGRAAFEENPLEGMQWAVAATATFLNNVDADNKLGHQVIFASLLSCLQDLSEGREPPKFFEKRLIFDRAPDSLFWWLGRADAAIFVTRLIDTKTQKKQAQQLVYHLLRKHGFPVRTYTQVGEWRRACMEGKAPAAAVRRYRETLAASRMPIRHDLTRDEAQSFYLEQLATHLSKRGFLPGDAKRYA